MADMIIATLNQDVNFYSDCTSTYDLSGDTRSVLGGHIVEVFLQEERRALIRTFAFSQYWWAWVTPESYTLIGA